MPERICVLLLLSMLALPVGGTASERPLHILTVHAYSQDYPWTLGQHQGFVTAIERGHRIEPHMSVEYLDTKRRGFDRRYAETYAAFLGVKYQPDPPNAIYVTDDNGLAFARDHLLDVFPDVPVFFSGVNDYSALEGQDRSRLTGVFEKKDILRNLELLEQLQADSGTVLVVGDGSNTYRAIETDIQAMLQQKPDLQVDWVTGPDMAIMEQRLRMSPNTPVLLTTLGGMRDAHGRALSLAQTIGRIRAASRAPIISMEDAYLLDGVQAGYVTSSLRQGAVAARLLTAWSTGTQLAQIEPVRDSPNEYVFNERAMLGLGLSIPDSMRTHARVIDPAPGFFERHKSLILSLIVILSGALMFSVFLLVISIGRNYE